VTGVETRPVSLGRVLMPPCSFVPREYWRPQRTAGNPCRPGLVARVWPVLSVWVGWDVCVAGVVQFPDGGRCVTVHAGLLIPTPAGRSGCAGNRKSRQRPALPLCMRLRHGDVVVSALAPRVMSMKPGRSA